MSLSLCLKGLVLSYMCFCIFIGPNLGGAFINILKNDIDLVEMSSGYCFLHFFSHISACDRSDPQVCEPTDLFMS